MATKMWSLKVELGCVACILIPQKVLTSRDTL